MPSLINNEGNVTNVAANYRQHIVPFSRFGTRKVAWLKVGYADTKSYNAELDVYQLDMENFDKIISAIQTQAEIVLIGAPVVRDNFGKFMVAVFEDTMNNGYQTDINGLADEGGPGYNNNSKTLQEVVREATGDSNLEISRQYLIGAPGWNYSDYEGFMSNNIYQEYDTKAQFIDNSYTQNDC